MSRSGSDSLRDRIDLRLRALVPLRYDVVLLALYVIVFAVSSVLIVYSAEYSVTGAQSLPEEPQRLHDLSVGVLDAGGTLDATTGTGAPATIDLPCDLYDVAPGDVVRLSATVEAGEDWYAYIATDYASFRVYANGELVLSYGERGTYSGFYQQAPPAAVLARISDEAGAVDLTVEYTVPSHYWGLRLKGIMVGSYDSLRHELWASMGFQLFAGVVIFALGVALMLVSVSLTSYSEPARLFFWLGNYSMAVGMWIFGECDLTCIVIQRPGILHAITYVGVFCSAIPLTHLARAIAPERHSWVAEALPAIANGFAILAIGLQLAGVWGFSESNLVFYGVETALYAYITLSTTARLVRARRTGSQGGEGLVGGIVSPQLFLFVMVVFDVSLVLELLNYYWLHWVSEMTFYLAGAVLFVVFMFANVLRYLRRSIEERERAREVRAALEVMRVQVDADRRQWRQMAESRTEARRLRHDLRHQIAALRGLVEQGDYGAVTTRLDAMSERIPSGETHVQCENFSISAVASYYLNRALEAGVTDVEALLDVPAELEELCEEDVCAIVGNLLDNASAAAVECRRAGLPAYVHLRARRHADLLTFVMDNSYVHVDRREDGGFASTKAQGSGVGLGSVAASAERNGGAARFEAVPPKDASASGDGDAAAAAQEGSVGVFRSNVYLHVRVPQGDKAHG